MEISDRLRNVLLYGAQPRPALEGPYHRDGRRKQAEEAASRRERVRRLLAIKENRKEIFSLESGLAWARATVATMEQEAGSQGLRMLDAYKTPPQFADRRQARITVGKDVHNDKKFSMAVGRSLLAGEDTTMPSSSAHPVAAKHDAAPVSARPSTIGLAGTSAALRRQMFKSRMHSTRDRTVAAERRNIPVSKVPSASSSPIEDASSLKVHSASARTLAAVHEDAAALKAHSASARALAAVREAASALKVHSASTRALAAVREDASALKAHSASTRAVAAVHEDAAALKAHSASARALAAVHEDAAALKAHSTSTRAVAAIREDTSALKVHSTSARAFKADAFSRTAAKVHSASTRAVAASNEGHPALTIAAASDPFSAAVYKSIAEYRSFRQRVFPGRAVAVASLRPPPQAEPVQAAPSYSTPRNDGVAMGCAECLARRQESLEIRVTPPTDDEAFGGPGGLLVSAKGGEATTPRHRRAPLSIYRSPSSR